jgi:hypothetical protein
MTFPFRIIGASALDVTTYEEVEADRTATAQAFMVVLASSIAGGIGSAGLSKAGTPLVPGVFFWSAVALIAWAAWALLVFQIGGRLLPEPETSVDVGELMRTIGFSAAPGMLRVLGILPSIAVPVFVLTTVWMLVAMVVAVRQALDYRSTWRAIGVCTLGLLFALVVAVAFGIFWGPTVS